MRYEEYTDEELVALFRDGEDGIVDYLMEKYKNLVRGQAGRMRDLGPDMEDLIQEGMIGLYKAIRDYDSGRDASFKTFAELCVSRTIYTYCTNSKRKKHQFLNRYISFYSGKDDGFTDDSKDGYLLDTLAAAPSSDPQEIVVSKEVEKSILQAINDNLTELEMSVMELYITGISTADIAKLLSRDAKSTDNALQRARGKLRKALERD